MSRELLKSLVLKRTRYYRHPTKASMNVHELEERTLTCLTCLYRRNWKISEPVNVMRASDQHAHELFVCRY